MRFQLKTQWLQKNYKRNLQKIFFWPVRCGAILRNTSFDYPIIMQILLLMSKGCSSRYKARILGTIVECGFSCSDGVTVTCMLLQHTRASTLSLQFCNICHVVIKAHPIEVKCLFPYTMGGKLYITTTATWNFYLYQSQSSFRAYSTYKLS